MRSRPRLISTAGFVVAPVEFYIYIFPFIYLFVRAGVFRCFKFCRWAFFPHGVFVGVEGVNTSMRLLIYAYSFTTRTKFTFVVLGSSGLTPSKIHT